jgi:hypothetical protein
LGIASAALMIKKTLLLLKNPWQLLSLAPHNPRASQVDPIKFPLKRSTQMQSLQLGNSFHEVLKYELKLGNSFTKFKNMNS